MSINWVEFTPHSALAGGALIGMAAAMLVLLNGRIAGVSGVLGGLLRPTAGDISWRVAFVLALVVSPSAFAFFTTLPQSRIDSSWSELLLAGLLVGLGTRYGAGCTSGHGVCGISRLSLRSLLATITFMAAGFAAVFIVRHLFVR